MNHVYLALHFAKRIECAALLELFLKILHTKAQQVLRTPYASRLSNLIMIVLSASAFACTSPLLAEEPWGKDAGFIQQEQPIYIPPPARNPIEGLAIALIRFHKTVISPADGPRSNFVPNSSQYTLDAIYKYGFCHGFLLGCDRLMRENKARWVYGDIDTKNGRFKYDPVR